VIAVLGPGGVGGLVAAALARAGEDVLVVAPAPTAERIARDGLTIESARLGDFKARPRAAGRLGQPADVLVVATKATRLAAALERVAVAPGLVVPLLNGLDHLTLLRARFGAERVCAGVIRVESERVAPGRVVQTSPFLRVDLAPPWPAVRDMAARLAAAGLPAHVHEREAPVMWGKLVRLCALACTTSAHDLPLGAILADPALAAELETCVAEAAAVARAEGAPIDSAATLAELAASHVGLSSSMRRDLAAGRGPELDAIAGAVLRAAARHDLACPTVAALAARIRARAGEAAVQ
jgi:2-dehydropantoate 2-reductase